MEIIDNDLASDLQKSLSFVRARSRDFKSDQEVIVFAVEELASTIAYEEFQNVMRQCERREMSIQHPIGSSESVSESDFLWNEFEAEYDELSKSWPVG